MGIRIAPVYLKREGAIEGKYAYSLGSDALYDFYKKLCDLKDEIEEKKEILSDQLSIKIKEQDSDEDRRVLINLKRNLYNLRKSSAKIIEEHAGLLNQIGMENELKEFMTLLTTMYEWQEEYGRIYEREEAEERNRLVTAYKENAEVLGKGMKFIHPSIMQKLRNYLSIPSEEHKAKERKCDDTIAKVITRAAHKTSPFSTFTHVGAGIMGGAEGLDRASECKYTTITKFNIVYALRMYEKVILVPEIIEQSTYRFADTLVYLRGKFYWTVLKDDPKKRKKVYKTVDELIKVNGNPVLESIYEEFRKKKAFSFKELQKFLMAAGMDEEKAKSLLTTLVNKQFFCNVQFLDQNSDDIIGSFVTILENYSCDARSQQIENTITNLKKIEQKLAVFDQEDADEQLLSLKEISEFCRAITTEYEIEDFDEKQILYMDSLLNQIEEIQPKEWDEVFQTLSTFQQFARVFDVPYRFQLLLGEKFHESFGDEKVSVHEKEHLILDTLLADLIANMDLWDNQLRISNDNFGISEIEKLERLKNQFLNSIFERKEQAQIHITTEELQKYIDQIPELAKKQAQSNSFFVQNTAQKDLKVLNDFYAGHMIFFSRFLRNMPDVYENDHFKGYIKETMWDENLADMYLMYGFNANRRKNLTRKAISLPNNRVINNTNKQFDQVVDFRELYMQYDAEDKRVKFYQNDEEIKPQFLGSLVTTLLPFVPALLHLLNFHVVLLKDIGYAMIFDFLDQNKDFDVKEFPRIVMNDNVVLSRRRWLVNTNCMKEILEAKDMEIVEKSLAWIHRHGLPRRAFVSKFFYKNEGLDVADDNTDKPMFMDMSSPVLTVLLKKSITNTAYMLIEEVLPDLRNNEQEPYVGEYIFEISQMNER